MGLFDVGSMLVPRHLKPRVDRNRVSIRFNWLRIKLALLVESLASNQACISDDLALCFGLSRAPELIVVLTIKTYRSACSRACWSS